MNIPHNPRVFDLPVSEKVSWLLEAGPIAKRLNQESLGDAVPARSAALRAEPQASQAKPAAAIASERAGPIKQGEIDRLGAIARICPVCKELYAADVLECCPPRPTIPVDEA